MSKQKQQEQEDFEGPMDIPELGSTPTELAKGIHQIKIAMENQRRINDARFMQVHQHLELKQGVHPQRALQCFQQADGDEKSFMRCLAPPQAPGRGGDQGQRQGQQGGGRRRPQQQQQRHEEE